MGNNQSGGEVAASIARKVGSVALAVSYFTPAAAITVPITAGAVVAGGTVTAIGYAADAEDAKKVGKWTLGLATDAAVDGISGGAIDGLKKCGTVVKLVKTGCEAYSSASDEVDRVSGEPFIPTPDPQKTLYIAKHFL